MSNTRVNAAVEKTSATKAYLALASSFASAFIAALLIVWTDTDPLTARDFVVALGAGLGVGAVSGGITYAGPPNRPL